MTNVEKLAKLGMLGDIRRRYGAKTVEDDCKDDLINQANNDQLMRAWAGWHLGDGGWWTVMKSRYNKLEKLSK